MYKRQQYGCDQASLIAIMQEIQGEFKYLSEEVLTQIAEKLGISTAKVYSVATFYENFSLEAKGKYIIKVCAGTACHVRKSQPIYDAIASYLGLTGKKKTSADGLFTLETVACLSLIHICADAVELAVAAGAIRETVEIIDAEDVPLQYYPGNTARIKIKAAGDLA